MDVRNEKVVVAGIGASGLDACMLLNEMGACVYATDQGNNDVVAENARKLRELYIETETGGHTESFISGCGMLVVSPGVPRESLPVQYAVRNNIPVVGEIELAASCCRGTIVAVTGTNGKSTVVSLLGDIFRKASRKTVVCGNIGNAFCGEIKNIDEETVVVLEVSSFQLEWITDFRPRVACILNITDDHLDRYADFKEYFDAKARITLNQGDRDFLLLNSDDAKLKSVPVRTRAKVFNFSKYNNVPGTFCRDQDVCFSDGRNTEVLFEMPLTRLTGPHNLENILAA
ncbi:MAG: UDP-N-acetylmuramoyl-L-alanine--D-glutamate ligase, partial [Candidatus Omnitrophota bacterium]